MNYDNYVAKVEKRFTGNRILTLDSLEVHHCYDDFGDGVSGKLKEYKLRYLTYIAHQNHITKESIISYSTACHRHTVDEYKSAMKSAACFSVLASEKVDQAAVDYVMTPHKMRENVFEMPVILDLATNKIHFMQKTPIWGFAMWEGFREYIRENLL